MQPPSGLYAAVSAAWGRPEVVFCDRFRLAALQDVAPEVQIVPLVVRCLEATADIRALRTFTKDGPLACAPESRALLTASLSAAMVVNDDAGNVRLKKRGTRTKARDDVAVALVFACVWRAIAGAPAVAVHAGRMRTHCIA